MQDSDFEIGNSMISQEEALTIGLRKYRELFPPNTIPPELEDAAILSQIPGKTMNSVLVTFSLHGNPVPFVLFKAAVSRVSGEVTVETVADWHELKGQRLDESTSL